MSRKPWLSDRITGRHRNTWRGERPGCRFLGGTNEKSAGSAFELSGPDGFAVPSMTVPICKGADPANICNRGANGQGLQMELSNGLRKVTGFFASLDRAGGRIRRRILAVRAAVRAAIPE